MIPSRAVSFFKKQVQQFWARKAKSESRAVESACDIHPAKMDSTNMYIYYTDVAEDHLSDSSGYSSSEDESEVPVCSSLSCPVTNSCPCCDPTSPIPPPAAFASPAGSISSTASSFAQHSGRSSVVSCDSGCGICPLPDDSPVASQNCESFSHSTYQGQEVSGEEEYSTLCSALESRLSFKTTIEQAHRDSPQMSADLPADNIRDSTSSEALQSSKVMTQESRTQVPTASSKLTSLSRTTTNTPSDAVAATLSHRSALRCFAISVWCRLSKSLQSRLDARDIASWLYNSEQALFAADWQQERILNTSTLALLHLMVRQTLNSRCTAVSGRVLQTDASQLKAAILACFYVVCSYSGQEITYPMWPYLATATQDFWSLTINLGLTFSRELLVMHLDQSQYSDELDLMAAFDRVDIRQCRNRLPKSNVPDSVGELLLEEISQARRAEPCQQYRRAQTARVAA